MKASHEETKVDSPKQIKVVLRRLEKLETTRPCCPVECG